MKKSKGRIVFEVINVIVLSLLSFACLFPLLNILAMSFSSSTAVAAGKVSIFPVEFNLYAYDYVVGKADFWKSLLRSVERVAIGLPLNMILTIMLAYPLSKESTSFRMRTVYVWIFFFTMLWPDSGLFANSESENDGYDLGVGASSSSSCLQRNFDVKFL